VDYFSALRNFCAHRFYSTSA